MKSPLIATALVALACPHPLLAADKIDIGEYASLSEEQTYDYLIKLSKKQGEFKTLAAKREAVIVHVSYVERHLGKPPYNAAALRKLLDDETKLEKYDARPRYEKIPPITEPISQTEKIDSATRQAYQFGPTVRDRLEQEKALAARSKPIDPEDLLYSHGNSVGPFRLRRTTGDINTRSNGLQLDGPDEKIRDAKGAKIAYSDNRLKDGSGAWNSEGVLYMPFVRAVEKSSGTDYRIGVAPAVSWNIQEQQGAGKSDVDELKFSAPFYWDTGGAKGYWTTILEPYYQTDTDFDGAIWGGTASLSFRGAALGTGRKGLYLNDWQFFAGNSASYKIGLKGLIDYSETHATSPYSKRKLDDDWLRAGLDASFSLGLFREKGMPEKSPLVLNVGYKFLDAFSGDGGYSDMWNVSLTYWVNDYVGFSGEYQKGETPVAKEEIDLITLGLELRY
ncbi:hypothetical protein [Luteolibacter luteus]|uniref:DUF3570 domain-containing protein n=1 Tax=Luteolibacter luteus TaxID=2728835 RepID=A0A858RRD6_9BACT|nr:hypothetical protein [Luteolibacter luteus]QJE99104.1 hypothetical protein HHL09_26100 [Luteolibacter luteus]